MKTWRAWARNTRIISFGIIICGSALLFGAQYLAGRTARSAGRQPSSVKVASGSGANQTAPARLQALGTLPLSFEENMGQTAPEVRYVSHGSGYELFLTPRDAVIALQHSMPSNLSPLHRAAYFRALRQGRKAGRMTVLRMRLQGAN